jgi:UDP-2,3-diacylglucosamine pyrophosphatase LpxH
MSNVYAIGDSHGNFKEIERWLKDFAKTGDILLHVGDFGCGFVHDKKIESLAKKFSDAGCRCLVIAGNHDEPIYFKENRKFKGGSIEFLPLTHFRKINNKGFLFLGGAISVDRYQRIEGRSWWRDEKFILEEEYLKSVRGVDYIIAHNCPDFAKPVFSHKGDIVDYYSQFDKTLVADLKAEGELFNRAWQIIKENNEVKSWSFGHWHVFKREFFENCEFRCYNIDEIDIIL